MSGSGFPKAPSTRPPSGGPPALPPPRTARATPPPPPIPQSAHRPPSRPSWTPAASAPGYTPPNHSHASPASLGPAEVAPWDEVNLVSGTTPEPLSVHQGAAFNFQPPPPAPAMAPVGYAPVSYGPAPTHAPNPDSLLGRTAARHHGPVGDPFATETLKRKGRNGWLVALICLAALGGGGYLAMQERDRLQSELHKQSNALAKAEARAEAAEKSRVEAERSLLAFKNEVTTKETASQSDQKLIGSLKTLLTSKEGEIEAAGKSVSVSLVDDVLFPSGKAELSLTGFRVLARLGKLLKEATDQEIVIGGHTDDRPLKKKGGFETNWELSSARAVNVVRYLVEEVGVPPSRISAAAYSQYKPRSKNVAKNRRIEVLLTPVVQIKPAH